MSPIALVGAIIMRTATTTALMRIREATVSRAGSRNREEEANTGAKDVATGKVIGAATNGMHRSRHMLNPTETHNIRTSRYFEER
jgi:hypothetical protein